MKSFLKFKNTKGEPYEFVFRKPDKRTWGEDCDGVCFYPVIGKHPTSILINPHRSNQVILNTVIHETTHAYFPDLTEKEVTAFGNTLSRILYNDLKYRVDEST
jgi:secreted PhoX family phosphatase